MKALARSTRHHTGWLLQLSSRGHWRLGGLFRFGKKSFDHAGTCFILLSASSTVTTRRDLVAMCVDDIVPMGAEPLFFLMAVGKLKGGCSRGCRRY